MVVSLDLGATDLASRRTLEDIISLGVAKSKRILVVTGAGISCSCGIPDFRSSDGLYNLVKKQYPNVVLKGRDLFDASLFRDPESTSVFYTFISQLKQSIDIATPSPTHHFIKMLDTKKKLLRSYTQNIDGLEARAGLAGSSSEEVRATGKGKGKLRAKDVRNVQLHGDIHRVRCTFCSADLPCTPEYLKLFDAGLAPDCPECAQRSEVRVARSARPIRIGTLRPAIVLYDEAHPLGDDIGTIQSADIARKPDMLIVMGTSLKVHGLRRLVKEFAKSVHGDAPSTSTATEGATGPGTGTSKPRPQWARKVIFVNKTPPGSEWNGIIDYHVSAETDAWAAKVLEYWRSVRPADWEIQRTLDDSPEFRHTKAAVGGGAGKGKGAKSSKSLKFSAPRASGVADDVSAATAATRTRPTASGMENVPPSAAENASAQGVKPPSLVAKRPRSSMSHYTAGECSPSKQARRANGDMPPPASEASRLAPEERGMLFGDTTNRGIGAGETATDAEDDGIPLAVVVKHKRRTKSVDARARAAKVVKVSRTPRPKQQVEVVMRRNRGRFTVRDAEADVVDVFS